MTRHTLEEKDLEALVAYVDDELDNEERERVDALVASSEEARAALAELEQLDAVLGEWEVEAGEGDPSTTERVFQQGRRRKRRRFPWTGATVSSRRIPRNSACPTHGGRVRCLPPTTASC